MKTQKSKTLKKGKTGKSISSIIKPKVTTKSAQKVTEDISRNRTVSNIAKLKSKAFGKVIMVNASELLYASSPFEATSPAEIISLASIIQRSNKFDPLVVNKRKNGKYYIIDGRKRHQAVKNMPEYNQVPVQVANETLSTAEEASWAKLLQYSQRSIKESARMKIYREATAKVNLNFEELVESNGKTKLKGIGNLTAKEVSFLTDIPHHVVKKDMAKLRTVRNAKVAKALSADKRNEMKRRNLEQQLHKQTIRKERLEHELKEVNAIIQELTISLKNFK